MISIGVIGYGYWGPNIVRNFHQVKGAHILTVCDKNSNTLKEIPEKYPTITCTTDYLDIINNPKIDVVAIVTPVYSHFKLAKEALLAGKHVFIEKPMTRTSQEAKELIELAHKKDRLVMVDYPFLFTGAVRKMKEIIDKKELGDLTYFDSTRINLGLFQSDINVIWDLAPHDFSIINHLVPNKLQAISAIGMSHFGRTQEDVGYVTMMFEKEFIAHCTFNWMSPVKVRESHICGRKKKIVWNDLHPDEKIKIYDKGVTVKKTKEDVMVGYRINGVMSPILDRTEPLLLEANHFIECIKSNTQPINDGMAGLRVVEWLEACDESMKQQGKLVKLP